jgi:hypothetical protein
MNLLRRFAVVTLLLAAFGLMLYAAANLDSIEDYLRAVRHGLASLPRSRLCA